MALLLPTAAVEHVADITPKLVSAMGACALILDVDNTLALHGSPEPFEGTVEWVQYMRSRKIRMIIVSNNSKDRVEPFAAKYGLPFLHDSFKPFPFAYHLAARKMGVRSRDAVVVGDQIFTDVIGANFAFMKSILLTPVGGETSRSFAVRRRLERPLRRRLKNSGRGSEYFK